MKLSEVIAQSEAPKRMKLSEVMAASQPQVSENPMSFQQDLAVGGLPGALAKFGIRQSGPLQDPLVNVPKNSIRSGLMGMGFTRGATNPQENLSIQDEALKRFAPKTSSTLVNFLGGLVPSAVGVAADIATDPRTVYTAGLAKVLGAVPEITALGETKIGNPFKTLFGKKAGPLVPSIKEVEAAIESTGAKPRELALNQSKNLAEIRKQVGETEKQLEDVIYKKSLQGRDKFKSYNSQLNNEFGLALRKEVGSDVVPADEYAGLLQEVADASGILGKEKLFPSEQKFLKLLESVKSKVSPAGQIDPLTNQLVETPQPQLKVTDIYDEFKTLVDNDYTQRIFTMFQEALAKKFPKLQEIRSSFAPRIQAKKLLADVFDPYNGLREYDATRPINFLRRAAVGDLAGDEVQTLKVIEDKFGKDFLSDVENVGKNILGLKGQKTESSLATRSKVAELKDQKRSLERLMKDLNLRADKSKFKEQIVKKAILGAAGATGAGLPAAILYKIFGPHRNE